MSSLGMSKLKGLLQEQVLKSAEAGSASSAAVIEAVRKAHPEAIRSVSTELENAALARIISQLGGRRPKDDSQPDIFAGYTGVHQFIGIEVEREGERVIEYKSIEAVTLRELGSWLSSDHKTMTTRRQRESGMTKLLRDLSAAAKGKMDMTVGAAMALRRARR